LKKNIFADSKKINTLFKDESVFDIDYCPEEIHARERETSEIKHLLSPLITKKKAQDVLIYGPPGTGKTLVTKFILNHLISYSSNIKFLYINAISDKTKHSILHKIALLFDIVLPRRGLAVDEIFQRIKESLSKASFTPIIVIDEIDQISSDACSEILYDLSRVSENKNRFCLILITNNKNFFLNLDARTQSSLFLNNVPFSRYSPKQLKEILKERVEYGLIKDVISDDFIGYVAGFSAKRGGDARIAIDLLYKSAKLSEKQGSLKISKKNLLEAAKLIDSIKFSEKKSFLSEEQMVFLKNIEDGMLTSELYKKQIVSERSARRYLSLFEKQNILRIEEINTGKGRKRKIFLNFEKDLLSM